MRRELNWVEVEKSNWRKIRVGIDGKTFYYWRHKKVYISGIEDLKGDD